MAFISYAQNFEDVMLWRSLGHLGSGFYIDVGAWDPHLDSVTKAFYLQGWNGINIEPVASFFRELEEARPRDINLQAAAGSREGERQFFEIPGSGLSSLDRAAAEKASSEQDLIVEERKVPVRTLAEICREHKVSEIHFLKVDVEGWEEEVLAGMDFAAYRPWIVLVEATLPNTRISSGLEWEDRLLSAGYTFVYFDGLNRFYLAEEHSELKEHFGAPPNCFDDFVIHRHKSTEERRGRNEMQIDNLNARCETLEATVTRLRQRVSSLKDKNKFLRQEVSRIYESRTWRYSRPFRRLADRIRGNPFD